MSVFDSQGQRGAPGDPAKGVQTMPWLSVSSIVFLLKNTLLLMFPLTFHRYLVLQGKRVPG